MAEKAPQHEVENEHKDVRPTMVEQASTGGKRKAVAVNLIDNPLKVSYLLERSLTEAP